MGSSKSTTNWVSMSSQDMQGQGAESQQLFLYMARCWTLTREKNTQMQSANSQVRHKTHRRGCTLSNDTPTKKNMHTSLDKLQRKQACWGPALSEPLWDTVMTCSHLCGNIQEWLKPERFTVLLKTCGEDKSAKQLAFGRCSNGMGVGEATEGWEPAPRMCAQ